MKISVKWLSEFVDAPENPRELKTVLTMAGLGVEAITPREDDWILEVEVTTNRPDCLSHYGIAREVAVACRKPLKKLECILNQAPAATSSEISIEIRDPELAARYCGRIVRNVKVGPSPEWLARRLEACGIRSINNVADATNYILLELGHPLHAFDLERLRQQRIIVRRAREGEPITTLDGVSRTLNAENLVIADAERPVALAGIMGGEGSAIRPETRSALLESAWFDPLSIRRTSKSQLLHTEASHRFERGADIEMAPLALDFAAGLVAELAGGEILRGIADVYPQPRRRESIELTRDEIHRLLGAEIPWEDVERILRALGFIVARRGTAAWSVTPPSFRLDVAQEVDVIEEVARHYGYNRLPARLLPSPPQLVRDSEREKELMIARTLVSLGYREISTPTLENPAESARFSDAPAVIIENPLSLENSALRTSTIPAMLAALRWNLDRRQEELRFFEMGKTYRRAAGAPPEEHRVLTIGLTGHRRTASVHDVARDLDFFDLKGDLERLLDQFDLPDLDFAPDAGCTFEPGLRGRYISQAGCIASFGRLADRHTDEYKLRRAVWLAEVDLQRLLAAPVTQRMYHSFSNLPAIERDLSLVVPAGINYQAVFEAVHALALPELVSFMPLEVLQESGGEHYSMLLHVEFQSADRTLTSEEAAELSARILNALTPLGVHLRKAAASGGGPA